MLAFLTGCTHTVYHAPGEAPRTEDVIQAARSCGAADAIMFPFPSGCKVKVVESADLPRTELERRLEGCKRSYPNDERGRLWCEGEAARRP